jgi:hypothetical protein
MDIVVYTDLQEVEIYIGTYGNKWVAASGAEPYFCVEADSDREVYEKLRRLVAFAKRGFAHLVQQIEERREPKIFTVNKKVLVRELEDA